MNQHILDPLNKDKNHLHELFEKISTGNTILFLGAGASITDKKYLSKEIIDYYEEKTGTSYGIKDIVEFVDVLSADQDFSRRNFDNLVHECLSQLQYGETQKTILSIKWRQIITTNYDLLLERAQQELITSSQKNYELVSVRSIKEYDFLDDVSQVKYIKLNGCLSDKSIYKLVFSSEDFKRVDKFYKKVLGNLANLSENINLLSVGYSFSDPLSKLLLKKFDEKNFKDRKWIYSVDPWADDVKLNYYKSNKIAIIKCEGGEFFKAYSEWEEKKYGSSRIVTQNRFIDSNLERVKVGNKNTFVLTSFLQQLNRDTSNNFVTEKDFYLGEEPNYQIINRGYDVVRQNRLDQVKKTIIEQLTEKEYSIFPIFFLSGSFGTGKTTFNYRLINNIVEEKINDFVAFEIIDPSNIKREYVIDLLTKIKAKNIIFYCNHVEVDSIFKSIIDFRLNLSTAQVANKKVCFILSIRENILEKFKKIRETKNMIEISIDSSLTDFETDDLLDRLKNNSLVEFRDMQEKDALRYKIKDQYKGDTFLSLMNLVSDGRHFEDLKDAYLQLSPACQEAFLYTALLHRFDLLMPASLLKDIVSQDWDKFTNDVIRVEGKGILIQQNVVSKGTDPDLYFRTKHPQIADRLIKEFVRGNAKKLSSYRRIISTIQIGAKSTKLIVDLLKALIDSGEMKENEIDRLYDLAHITFEDEPYFLLHYSINLQKRNTIQYLKKALDILRYAEGLLPRRNNRFTHRRAVINFQLAKHYYKSEKELVQTITQLDAAKEFFLLKQQLDPCSSYSYTDFLGALVWELEHVEHTERDELKLKVYIEDMFEQALNAISDGVTGIIDLQDRYNNVVGYTGDLGDYLMKLEELYEKSSTRPYACILLYNYFAGKDEVRCNTLLNELEAYVDSNEEVGKYLFKVYGRELYDANTRVKFYKLVSKMRFFEDENPLRYYYFLYVAEAYSSNFSVANSYLQRIENRYQIINPEYRLKWMNPDGYDTRVFEGKIVKSTSNNTLYFRSTFLQSKFRIHGTSIDVKEGDLCFAELHFYLNGVRAVLQTDKKEV